MKIKGLISENTIILKYDGHEINIQRDQDESLFREVSQLLIDRNEAKLISKFLDLKKRLEEYSQGTFSIDNNQIVLKGDKTPLPLSISKKLLQMESEGEDFMPLIRFWKKLRDNPSKNSREQLYGFMLANDIPLTEQGDIVVEKGVRQKGGGLPGELVDCYSNKVDNSIGMIVEMPRNKVNDDPNQTCSYGLHVGAPKYVRQYYSGDIIIECIVNPADVVSVPTDYNNTKMRCCRYQVMGYSDKSRTGSKVIKLSDFFKSPTKEVSATIKKQIAKPNQSFNKDKNTETVKSLKSNVVVETANIYQSQLDGKTAKQIVEYVQEKTGVLLEGSLKNKKSLYNKGAKQLEIHALSLKGDNEGSTQEQIEPKVSVVKSQKSDDLKVNLTKYNKKENRAELIKLLKDKFNEDVSKFAPTKGLVNKARKLFTDAGYTVKG